MERMKNLEKAKRSAQQVVQRLRERANDTIQQKGVYLQEEDVADMDELAKQLEGKIKSTYAPGSFMHIFWEQQLQYNNLNSK